MVSHNLQYRRLEKNSMENISIQYHFTMEDGQTEQFNLQLDPESMDVIRADNVSLPEWTRLSVNQCPNCTLATDTHPYCPPAVNMVDVVHRFDAMLSHDETTVVVDAEGRRMTANTTVQRAVSSLMGLLMAASGCPMTVFFKPMARYHWPFASMEETLWRAISAYLIAQYFHHNDGGEADTQFTGLSHIYHEVQTVNMAFAKRLRKACQYDGMINGIILLDMFAKSMPDAIDEALSDMAYLFAPFNQMHEPSGSS